MSSTVNHHVAMATERTIHWSLGRPPRISLRRLVVAEFLDITGLPDGRQSRVTRQGCGFNWSMQHLISDYRE